MQLHLPYWRRKLVATDPGRVRVTTATATALSVLVTSLVAWSLVVHADADRGLLAMGVIMTLQAALNVKDPTARERLVTTLLLIPPAFAALAAAVLLSSRRPVEIVVFIALTGAVTYLRGFGPRAAAIGAVTFFAYFFALLLQPKIDDLPLLFLVTGCAVASMLVIRLFDVWGRPRHQLALLLAELRGAGAAALTEAVDAPPATALAQAARVRRVDQVARTIDGWQARYTTERYIRCDATTLARRVLDARIDMDHACRKIAELRAGGGHAESGTLTAPAINDLAAVLSSATSPEEVRKAADRAHARLTSPGTDTPDEVTAGAADRATLSFARLRALDLHHALGEATTEETRRHPRPQQHAAPSPGASSRWKPWLRWKATTRMAVQVVIAAGLASVVGYSISASRWYWAVLTAFLVFAGTTTRGAILTRASRRIAGTVAGVVVGLALVVLVDGNLPALIVICVLAVFFALYLGPLQYTVMSFFITLLLAGLYGLLGVLNRHILELRLVETLAGAALGVVCAYLIFSTSSHPVLTARIATYFDALDRLLNDVRHALTGSASADTGSLVASIRAMDSAQADLHTTVDGMSLSLAVGHRAENTDLLRLLDIGSHVATRLGQSALTLSAAEDEATAAGSGPGTDTGTGAGTGDDLTPRFDRALAHVLASSATARAALVDGRGSPVDPDETTVIDYFGRFPGDPLSPQYEVVRTLSRLNWTLLRSVQVRTT